MQSVKKLTNFGAIEYRTLEYYKNLYSRVDKTSLTLKKTTGGDIFVNAIVSYLLYKI